MLLLGVFSILQVIIIPGYLVIHIIKIKTDSPIQKWLYIFSFSLFINYALVTILTLLSIYKYYIMYTIVSLELIYILIFCRKELWRAVSQNNISDHYFKFLSFFKSNNTTNRTIIIISGLVIAFYVSAFFANLGTIFYFFDTVYNYEWNSWAIDFTNNILPKYSFHFPQLLPANWSVIYLITGRTDINFFAKAIMPLFFIGNLLMFVDLSLLKKNVVFLIALIIYGLIAPFLFSLIFMVDGNADLPVSFFVLLTFYLIFKNYNGNLKKTFFENNRLDFQSFLLTFLFASMAASTKLAGLYCFVLVSILLLILFLLNVSTLKRTDIIKMVSFIISVGFLSLFWYLRTPVEMASGLHQPQYLPKDYSSIVIRAVELIYYNLGLPIFAFVIITLIFSLLNKNVRYITIMMVFIPAVLWIFKYSVEFRNLSFVMPFTALCSAFGLIEIINLLKQKSSSVFNLSSANNYKLSFSLLSKQKILLYLTSLAFIILLSVSLSDSFYLFLYNIYIFMYKYYFHSNRIIYFIEYGFLLHVDFFQRVLTALCIAGIIIPLLISAKVKIKYILLAFFGVILFLNFTFIQENDLTIRHKKAFDKVDARNYYDRLVMIKNSYHLTNQVLTNFYPIVNDRIPRELIFRFLPKISSSLLETNKNAQFFLKINSIDRPVFEFIRTNKANYRILYEDGDFIFFSGKP